MPLARITAPLPEYFDRLAQDLRARGFDVETASPGQYFPTAADLEITVRQCAPEDASKIAASTKKDMCVLMSPDARNTGIRSVEMIVLQPRADAVERARNFVTPAQIIEISTTLLNADALPVAEATPEIVEKPKTWPKVKVAAQSTWDEIAKTTAHWLEIVTAAIREKCEKINVKAFLTEIGEETRKLGKDISASVGAAVRRTTTNVPDENERLVPSMFDFSEELSSEEASPVVEAPKSPVSVDRRVWKATGAAALAATAVLVAVSVMHKPHQVPAAAVVTPGESKTALPATASLKPSALVPGKSPVHMVSTRQIIHSEASDTVVRYGTHKSLPKTAESHPGIKRYSDLD
jgi:hypothetical protein